VSFRGEFGEEMRKIFALRRRDASGFVALAALGARSSDILGMVMGRGLLLAITGISLGAALACAAGITGWRARARGKNMRASERRCPPERKMPGNC